MQMFRKILFWSHLISGVLAGIFIFVMCVTGALLSFESNILEFAEKNQRVVEIPSENAAPLPINSLIAKFREAKPDAKPTGITLQNDKTAAVNFALGREGQFYVDPYTGAITGEGAKSWRGFFGTVENLHRWLAIPRDGRFVGKTINDAANFLFLILAITGVYIWFPRHWTIKHLRPILWFRKTHSTRARNFNWHTVIGFWTSLVLIILTLTAVVMSYQWANNLLYRATGNEPPPQQAPPGGGQGNPPGEQTYIIPDNLDELLTKAENYTNWKTVALRLPLAKDQAIFTIDEGKYWNRFGRSTLTIDAKTGEVAKWESYGEQNAGRQLRSWVRFTHTGETGGFFGQLIGFIACVGGAFLVWTGISLALNRFGNWRARRSETV